MNEIKAGDIVKVESFMIERFFRVMSVSSNGEVAYVVRVEREGIAWAQKSDWRAFGVDLLEVVE